MTSSAASYSEYVEKHGAHPRQTAEAPFFFLVSPTSMPGRYYRAEPGAKIGLRLRWVQTARRLYRGPDRIFCLPAKSLPPKRMSLHPSSKAHGRPFFATLRTDAPCPLCRSENYSAGPWTVGNSILRSAYSRQQICLPSRLPHPSSPKTSCWMLGRPTLRIPLSHPRPVAEKLNL